MSNKHVIRSGDGTVQVLCPVCKTLNSENAIRCEKCGYCLRCED